MDTPTLELTAGEIASVVGGRLTSGDPNRLVQGFSIDSRTLMPGDLFFGIRGDRFDGSEFTDSALRKGAVGVVASRQPTGDALAANPVVILVGDSTDALQSLARYVRRHSRSRVVAITGSAGKTTTKEVTAAFLSRRYRVFRNRGNLNNHIGLPLSLLELRHRPEVAVVEFGMNHPGEVSRLTAIAEPDVRVWTNVAEAHLQFFSSVDDIADAKAEILEGADDTTVLVANADDDRIVARLSRFAGEVVTFGIDRPADVRAANVRDLGVEGTEADLTTPSGDEMLHTPLIGRGNLANVLAAIAVALHFGVPLGEIVEEAARLRAVAARGEVLRLTRLTVIDDSYNSNPRALALALGVLAHEARHGRRGAVLGEMLELGDRSAALHEASGRVAARSGLAWLVTVGSTPAAALAHAAIAAGMPATAVRHVLTSDLASDAVMGFVKTGDLVLVKGSRGVRTDQVVSRLKAEFA